MVDRVYPCDHGLLLEDILGRRKIVKAKIVELALVDHRIILEEECSGLSRLHEEQHNASSG